MSKESQPEVRIESWRLKLPGDSASMRWLAGVAIGSTSEDVPLMLTFERGEGDSYETRANDFTLEAMNKDGEELEFELVERRKRQLQAIVRASLKEPSAQASAELRFNPTPIPPKGSTGPNIDR